MGVDAHEARGAGGGGLEEVKVKGKVDGRVGRGVEMGCCPGAAGGSSAGGRRRGGGGARGGPRRRLLHKIGQPAARRTRVRRARGARAARDLGWGWGSSRRKTDSRRAGLRDRAGGEATCPTCRRPAKNRKGRLEMLTAALPPLGGRPRPRRRYAGGGGVALWPYRWF